MISCIIFCALLGFVQELPPVPPPDTGEMDAPVVAWIAGLHQQLETAKSPEAALALHGRLGHFYHGFGRLQTAELFYRNAQRLDPDQPTWSYCLGMLALDANQLEEAEKAFRKVLVVNPEDLQALVRLGNVLLGLNRPEEAGSYFEKAAVLAPNAAMVAYGRARVADVLGNPTVALTHYRKALSLQPQASMLHYPYGLALRRAGQREAAREMLAKRGDGEIVFPDPRMDSVAEMVVQASIQVVLAMAADAETSLNDLLSFIHSHLGGREGLVNFLSDAASDLGTRSDGLFAASRLHYAVGMELLARQEWDWANGHFIASLRAQPSPDALVQRSNYLARKDKWGQALTHLEKALGLDEGHREALFAAGNILLTMDRPEDARLMLEKLVVLEPEAQTTRKLLLRTLETLGDLEAARIHQEALITLLTDARELAAARLKLGQLYFALENVDGATDQWQRVLSQPEIANQARFFLARAYALKGNHPQAIEMYDAVLVEQPDALHAHLGKYAALIYEQRYAKAKSALIQAMSHLPNETAFTHLMARLLVLAPSGITPEPNRALALAQASFDAQHTLNRSETLAMALAAAGRASEAADLQEQLIGDAKGKFSDATLQRLERHFSRYQKGLSCCENVPKPDLFLPND